MDRLTKGKRREEAVLAAAAQAIAELGYANVRVSDIAERAQMTPGHVTYYFPSKNDLLLLAIRRSEEELIEQSRERLSAIADPWQRLRRLIELSAADGVQDEGWALWLQVWGSGMADDTVSSEHQQLDERWFRILIEVIEYGSERGAFRVADIDDAAEIVSAMIDGLSIQVTVGSPRVDRDRALRLCELGAARVLGFAGAPDTAASEDDPRS
ncbi:TetR/AcrR family transcriptional regulator [Leifsonia aquatica]|uniref:TetR/AcrR family transcriptional regulator n=1 Tax=Leifsonia aquatica TaxID=144185 RepID=UPI000469CD55|nr:TetR/AcrR family transcriptional regulator [Leifsonia aquatica]